MCYSAKVKQQTRLLERRYGATLDLPLFKSLFRARLDDPSIKVARALEANFDTPQSEEEHAIKADIDAFRSKQEKIWEAEVFKQKRRLADAQRTLVTKPTQKKALNDVRVATNKIEENLTRLSNSRRTEAKESDSRIYPKYFAPVIVSQAGRRLIRPMRYLCRLPGTPASFDAKYPGCYNARRDNLERFWKPAFGSHHAIMIVSEFWENVAVHLYEKRPLAAGEEEKNVVLHFNPNPPIEMVVACIWSHWSAPGERELDSFAAVTDEPPPEIAATGHNRCIIPIKAQNVNEWLSPASTSPQRLQEILSDRETPYYEHRIAA